MVVKFIESTYDSFRDKLKSPFFGTLILVWIVRNRNFIYNIFFNDNCTHDEKLIILKNHFDGWNAFQRLILTILISLGIMILIYVSLNLSRFIVQYSEKILKPKILALFSKSNIVTREDYTILEQERDYYQKRYTIEREARSKIERLLDEQLKESNIVVDGGVIGQESDVDDINDLSDQHIQRVVSKIIESGLGDRFKKLIYHINSKTPGEEIETKLQTALGEFLSMNLIAKKDSSSYLYYYNFTPYGIKVRDKFLQLDSYE